MGFALATEAAARGAEVTVVAGPTSLPAPPACRYLPVTSAAEMAAADFSLLAEADIFIGAAAVADFRPAHTHAHKLPKSAAPVTLTLEPTLDIIAEVRRRRPDITIVGFAAETDNLQSKARAKLERKGMDLVVANQVGPQRGFGEQDTEVLILSRDGAAQPTPKLPKDEIAALILDSLEALLTAPASP
jgi:phosphopantothenoylcysteine decarboxylase/phosphopantothenate--cysteine ligase